jgi:excisionase family DNA binding protein
MCAYLSTGKIMDATFLTTTELAKTLKVHRNTIKNLLKRGLPHMRVGALYRFELETVREWMKRQTKVQ